MNEKRKRRPLVPSSGGKTVIKAIIASIALVTLFVGGILFFVTKLLEPVSTVTHGFVEYIRDEDYEAAFNLLSSGLKIRVEGADRLQLLMNEYGAHPESWSFNNQSVRDAYGRFVGDVTLATGDSVPITILLELDADHVWRITHFEWGMLNSRDM